MNVSAMFSNPSPLPGKARQDFLWLFSLLCISNSLLVMMKIDFALTLMEKIDSQLQEMKILSLRLTKAEWRARKQRVWQDRIYPGPWVSSFWGFPDRVESGRRTLLSFTLFEKSSVGNIDFVGMNKKRHVMVG